MFKYVVGWKYNPNTSNPELDFVVEIDNDVLLTASLLDEDELDQSELSYINEIKHTLNMAAIRSRTQCLNVSLFKTDFKMTRNDFEMLLKTSQHLFKESLIEI